MRLVRRLALFALVPPALLAGEPAVQHFRPVACSATDRTLVLAVDDALLEVRDCEAVRIDGDRNWIRLDPGVRALELHGDDNVAQRSSGAPLRVKDRGDFNVVLEPFGSND